MSAGTAKLNKKRRHLGMGDTFLGDIPQAAFLCFENVPENLIISGCLSNRKQTRFTVPARPGFSSFPRSGILFSTDFLPAESIEQPPSCCLSNPCLSAGSILSRLAGGFPSCTPAGRDFHRIFRRAVA